MKMRGAVVAVAFMVMMTVAASANLLANPGLENGDLTGWSTFGANWRASSWPADVHNGSWSVLDEVQSTDVDEWRGLYQLVPVGGGLSYDYTAYEKTFNVESGKSESWLELQWFDSLGNQISQWQSDHVTADQGFTLIGTNGIVAPLNAVTASVRAITHMQSAPTDTDYHMFDDFSLTESVPEPTTLGLLGLAIGALAVMRRRTRA
jgi:hypothetical protein